MRASDRSAHCTVFSSNRPRNDFWYILDWNRACASSPLHNDILLSWYVQNKNQLALSLNQTPWLLKTQKSNACHVGISIYRLTDLQTFGRESDFHPIMPTPAPVTADHRFEACVNRSAANAVIQTRVYRRSIQNRAGAVCYSNTDSSSS